MPLLFDTDAISEVLRPRPSGEYLEWLGTIEREDQYTSAIVIGELYKGAFASARRDWHLANIDERVLPALSVLAYDVATARVYGEIRAALATRGRILADADLQIAATALQHDLQLVTGNLRHFERVPRLRLCRRFAELRARPG